MDILGEKHDVELTNARDRITNENSELENIRNKIDGSGVASDNQHQSNDHCQPDNQLPSSDQCPPVVHNQWPPGHRSQPDNQCPPTGPQPILARSSEPT